MRVVRRDGNDGDDDDDDNDGDDHDNDDDDNDNDDDRQFVQVVRRDERSSCYCPQP